MRLSYLCLFNAKHDLEGIGYSYFPQRFIYAPHVIDTEYFCPGINERDGASVLSIAWMSHDNAMRKGIYDTIKSIPLVLKTRPKTRFIFAGKLEDDNLLKLVAALGIQGEVVFLGEISREEKLKLLRTCTIYLQPTRFEGFGVAILEAMACGCSVISCKNAGEVEHVVGNSGVLLNGRSPEEISSSVIKLLDSDLDRKKFGQAAVDRAREYFSFPCRSGLLKKAVDQTLIEYQGH